MNIKALASQIGMDYDNVIESFCGEANEIRKKLDSFISDCAFVSLTNAINDNNESEIKKCAHKIKKVSEKLGLTQLIKASSLLEDAKSNKLSSCFTALEKEYLRVEEVLKKEV